MDHMSFLLPLLPNLHYHRPMQGLLPCLPVEHIHLLRLCSMHRILPALLEQVKQAAWGSDLILVSDLSFLSLINLPSQARITVTLILMVVVLHSSDWAMSAVAVRDVSTFFLTNVLK